jgi:V/A-type H+-transporting ATPase subunit C
MERMLEARTDEEAAKVLSECGYGDVIISSADDLEQALSLGRYDMLSLLERVIPDRKLTDVFRVKYDYHNLKAILKSEAKSLNPSHLLIDSGRIRVKQLADMLLQDDIRDLPPVMRVAATEAREVLARTGDPQQSDMILDHAFFKEMRELALSLESEFLKGYVELLIDVTNLRALVRALRIGRGIDFLRNLLVKGGKFDTGRLISIAVSDSSFSEFYEKSLLEQAAAAGEPAMRGETSLTAFERLCDEALVKYMKASKFVAFGDQPLIAYIAAREAEVISIRTIMSGRKAGVSPDVIRERLREAYV